MALNPDPSCNEAMRLSPRTPILIAAVLLLFAAVAAYHNSFSVPFLYDDSTAIIANKTIRQLWPIGPALSPPPDVTTSGRPIVNLSLAVNHALSGYDVRSYHAVNLAIHVLAALTLFGIVRRTLKSPALAPRFGPDAVFLSATIAGLWLLHPLQTESVTYLVQRAESLMALFYLLTLYCFIRSAADGSSRIWWVASIGACVLGMASKEVMVSAPLLILLYDRTFISGTFGEAWQRRRAFYGGLAATWILLGWLVASTGGNRGGSAGFGGGLPWWVYAQTQLRAIVHYLRLSLWPHPLVFDYGIVVVKKFSEVAAQAVFIALLAGGTLVAVWRRPALGFAGIWFFALLAPSSSFVPVVTETIAEHRMYLPLAAVVALGVIGGYVWLGRRSFVIFIAGTVLFGGLTERRNRDYATAIALWRDTASKRPDNPRAHNQLGLALAHGGQPIEAGAEYREVLRLKPDDPEAHFNVGTSLLRLGRPEQAIGHFEQALRLKPGYADALSNCGLALSQLGRIPEAIARYQAAARLDPANATTRNNLGIALAQTGQLPEAMRQFEKAVELDPVYAEAHNNRGYGLMQQGRLAEAITSLQKAVDLDPDYGEAQNNFALALEQAGRTAESISHFEAVLRLEPTYADGHYHLGEALASVGRIPEAITRLEQALQLQPQHASAAALLLQLRPTPRSSPALPAAPATGK